MLLVGADHWQRLEQLVELDHAPAAPAAAGWMGPATVLGITTVLVESVAARSLGLSRTQRRCRRAMRPRLEPSGGLWEQRGDTDGRRKGIDECLKNVTISDFVHHTRVQHTLSAGSLAHHPGLDEPLVVPLGQLAPLLERVAVHREREEAQRGQPLA